MSTWFLVIWLLVVAALVVAAAMRPGSGKLSRYELTRRAELGDKVARADLYLYRHRAGLVGMVHVLQLLLATFGFFIMSLIIGSGWGFAVMLATYLVYPVVVRWAPVQRFGRRLYMQLEQHTEQLVARAPWLLWLVRAEQSTAPQLSVSSREELLHSIDQAGAHLSDSERQLLLHSLSFEQRTVREVMTSVDRLVTIDRHELLGPLVLDDLHRTGRNFFPVTNGSVRQIIGILGIDGFLTLDNKRSVTAEKAMAPHVVYVRDTASLRVAIKLFLQSHQHLLVVEDEQGEVVGVVTLHDCLKTLFGH